jgi:hypothetical protein
VRCALWYDLKESMGRQEYYMPCECERKSNENCKKTRIGEGSQIIRIERCEKYMKYCSPLVAYTKDKESK